MKGLNRLASMVQSIVPSRYRSGYDQLYDKYRAFTMIGRKTFVHNLKLIDRFRTVEGCIVECGVWRGGSIAAISDILGPKRTYHLFDSFEGLPPVKEIDGAAANAWQANKTARNYYDNCAAPREYAEKAMHLAGASRVHVHPGWFEATLAGFEPDEPIAILRLDADWYESTMTCLQRLFPFMSPGGVIIIDDYMTWDGCSRAVHDYLSHTKSAARIQQWQNEVTYVTIPGIDKAR